MSNLSDIGFSVAIEADLQKLAEKTYAMSILAVWANYRRTEASKN